MREEHTRRNFLAVSFATGAAAVAGTGRAGATREFSDREVASAVINASQSLESRLGAGRQSSLKVGCEPRKKGGVTIVTQYHTPEEVERVRRKNDAFDVSADHVPDTVEGRVENSESTLEIPVEIQHRAIPEESPEQIAPHDHDPPDEFEYDNEYDPLASGGQLLTSSSSLGSLGAPAVDDDGTKYVTTAGHVASEGDLIYQHDFADGRQIGEVVESVDEESGPGGFDGALIELNDGESHEGGLAVSSGWSFSEMENSIGMIVIVQAAWADVFYSKRGARTGWTSGAAGGVISWDDYTFWVDANAFAGDSGGSSYDFSQNRYAGSVNGPRAPLLDDPSNDPSEPEWHQTVYTAYDGFKDEFEVTIEPHD